MELRHLRYFVAVGELENVSRAALKLHVSQLALSAQIRDLEEDVGFSLLERTAKSVRLTDAGRVFLDHARAVLQQVDEAVKAARAVAAGELAELHVAFLPGTIAAPLMVPGNGVYKSLLQFPMPVVSPFFAFCVAVFFAIALKVFDRKGGSAKE